MINYYIRLYYLFFPFLFYDILYFDFRIKDTVIFRIQICRNAYKICRIVAQAWVLSWFGVEIRSTLIDQMFNPLTSGIIIYIFIKTSD